VLVKLELKHIRLILLKKERECLAAHVFHLVREDGASHVGDVLLFTQATTVLLNYGNTRAWHYSDQNGIWDVVWSLMPHLRPHRGLYVKTVMNHRIS
jgi:hypothetical protein